MRDPKVHLSEELLAVTAATVPWRMPACPDIAAAFVADIRDHVIRRSVWLGPILWESPTPEPSRRLERRAHAAACKAKGVCYKCGSADLHPESTVLCRRHLQRQRRAIRKYQRRRRAAQKAPNNSTGTAGNQSRDDRYQRADPEQRGHRSSP